MSSAILFIANKKPGSGRFKSPWKGEASYYSLEIDGKKNEDAAWYYPKTSELARNIEGRIAFWKGVKVIDQTY